MSECATWSRNTGNVVRAQRGDDILLAYRELPGGGGRAGLGAAVPRAKLRVDPSFSRQEKSDSWAPPSQQPGFGLLEEDRPERIGPVLQEIQPGECGP